MLIFLVVIIKASKRLLLSGHQLVVINSEVCNRVGRARRNLSGSVIARCELQRVITHCQVIETGSRIQGHHFTSRVQNLYTHSFRGTAICTDIDNVIIAIFRCRIEFDRCRCNFRAIFQIEFKCSLWCNSSRTAKIRFADSAQINIQILWICIHFACSVDNLTSEINFSALRLCQTWKQRHDAAK